MESNAVAIVPALNEAKTVGTVVWTLVNSGVFKDVIVVDDGSTDDTGVEAEKAGASVIRLSENQGKGLAMAAGVHQTVEPVICFFDADLRGLQPEHIQQLIDSVISDRVAMNVGTVDRGWLLNWLSRILPAVSGQRAMQREVFEGIPPVHVSDFGIEVALNYSCQVADKSIGRMILPGLSNVGKTEKVGFWIGMLKHFSMWYRVVRRAVLVRMDRKLFKRRHKTHHFGIA